MYIYINYTFVYRLILFSTHECYMYNKFKKIQAILNRVILEVTKQCEKSSERGNMGIEQADAITPNDSSPTDQHKLGVESIGPKGQTITDFQFEIAYELLPNLNQERFNPERKIIIHPRAMANTSLLAIDTTPLPIIRRIRQPGPFNVSPFISSFGSETGQNLYRL